MYAKVGVHVEHSGVRAAWRTHIARMASCRRSTLLWPAGDEAGLCALPAATAIDHMQLLMDEVGGAAVSSCWRDGSGTSPRCAVLSKQVVFCLYLRNG